LRNED